MEQITIPRETLLAPLQQVANLAEKRHVNPILTHILAIFEKDRLTLIGTDNDLEIRGTVPLTDGPEQPYQITLPGKKCLDICRSLPEGGTINLTISAQQVVISCGLARFALPSFPPQEFPLAPLLEMKINFTASQAQLRHLLHKTSFSIPQQDVRQYLNGLVCEITNDQFKALATDGHRLALCEIPVENAIALPDPAIIPKKTVGELFRLLEDSDEKIIVGFNSNSVQFTSKNFVLTSKLINSKFPNYNRVIPQHGGHCAEINSKDFKQALLRVGILSNEIFRSVLLKPRGTTLTLETTNQELGEAHEEIAIDYTGPDLDIVLNVGYLTDILNVLESPTVKLFLQPPPHGVLLEEGDHSGNPLYVLMPIRQ